MELQSSQSNLIGHILGQMIESCDLIGVMRKLDMEKVSKLPTANDMLDEKYGKEGTASRAEFDAKALAWYYGQLIRDRRKDLKLTQREVAEKIGREQTYIARVEKGKTDLQLSSFFRIAAVLGIQLVPTFVSVMK